MVEDCAIEVNYIDLKQKKTIIKKTYSTKIKNICCYNNIMAIL